MRVAIVGSGIAALGAAHNLRGNAHITLLEANDYFGGHTHTVDATLPGPHGPVTHGVDTGFLVYNERTYPRLIALFAELGVVTAPAQMSFSVQVAGDGRSGPVQWGGASAASVFAQRRNLVRPAFWGMLRDLMRFNALTTRIATAGNESELQQPLGDFLRQHQFSSAFCNWYFLPMMACIWSCPAAQMLQFPVATMIRFCHNHGLLQIRNRPQWHTVRGGARQYVEKILASLPDKRLRTPVRAVARVPGGVHVMTDAGTEMFDHVVLATHSDQALSLLRDATASERQVLAAFRYHPNRAILHTDASVLPSRRSAWAAWNYERAAVPPGTSAMQDAPVCLHYLLNLLQPLPWRQPVLVSLNPLREIPAHLILGSFDYSHPVLDQQAITAQGALDALQGYGGTHFCGAWTGYGFHEDGLRSGQAAAQRILQSPAVVQREAA